MHFAVPIRVVLTVALTALPMATPQALPEGEGKKLLEERCAGCHSLNPVVSLQQSRDSWKELIDKMRGYGAQLNNKEFDVATEYLTKHFGPKNPAAGTTTVSPEEKTAEKYIKGICASCHDVGLVRSTQATRKEWFDIVMRMNSLDAGVSARDVEILVNYLASKYGPKKN